MEYKVEGEELIGCEATFRFNKYKMDGEIVGYSSGDGAWFLPKEAFVIPRGWSRSKEYPGAFATSTTFLFDIHTPKDEQSNFCFSEEDFYKVLYKDIFIKGRPRKIDTKG